MRLLQLPSRNGRFPRGKLVLSIGLWVQSLFRAAEHYMGRMVPKIPWPVHLAKAASLGRAVPLHSSGACRGSGNGQAEYMLQGHAEVV